MRTCLTLLAVTGLTFLVPAPLPAEEHDVVVYGGTSGGVAAAVQAARLGKSVVLIEPGKHLGGLSSGGLGATDIGNKKAIGGLAREFYQRLRKHYDQDAAWKQEKRADFRGRGHEPGEDTAWTFEPHVAEKIFNDLAHEHKVKVVLGRRLDLKSGVKKDGTRIVSITMESGAVYAGKVFIDATYEGDLMARAGVSYHVGREANKTYGETLNGVQTGNATHHQFERRVSPYVVAGDPKSGLLPGILPEPPGPDGSADDKVQAFCFRLCLTDDPNHRVPIERPTGYDARDFELLLRNLEAGDHRLPCTFDRVPNRKTDSNNRGAVATDCIGGSWRWPHASYKEREQILATHRRWQQGLLWTLQNDPRVPEPIRREYRKWGLARDEFVDHGHWPPQLYVRESRRLVAGYVVTEHDCMGRRRAEDSVGLASYTMDSHHVQRYVDREGHVRNEGDVQVRVPGPFPVSYQAIVPRRDECENLLVPVCLSASHIAFGSIRMEPVFMVLGQSAATAVSLAIERGVAVQDVPYPELRACLLAYGQRL
jgi:hypothetical protein